MGAVVNHDGVRREAHAVILLLVGGTLLRIALDGDFARYVKLALRPYLIVAGAVIVVVALLTLAESLRRPEPHAGPAHRHGRFDVAWLLTVPMAVLLYVGPPAVGAFAAARTGSALAATTDPAYPPLPAGDPLVMSVVDFASRAVFDERHSLAGRTVALTGFLTSAPGGEFYLTRMVISCCAADAAPIKVGLTGALPAGAASDTWVRVTGALSAHTGTDPINGATVPFLAITSAVVVTVPARPYET
jgi:uncharacterized repeat protein (TIGR03943 family)